MALQLTLPSLLSKSHTTVFDSTLLLLSPLAALYFFQFSIPTILLHLHDSVSHLLESSVRPPAGLLNGNEPPLFRHRPFLPVRGPPFSPSRQCESGKGNECPSVSQVRKKELGRGRGADRRAEHVDVGRPSVTFRENICSF